MAHLPTPEPKDQLEAILERALTAYHRDPRGFTAIAKEAFYPYSYTEPERASEAFPDAYVVHRWGHTSWRP